MSMTLPKLYGFPLLASERDGLAAGLARSDLPADDLDGPGRLFWRFTTPDELPAGFGGLEIHGKDALMRSIVILPPMRGRGYGKAVVAALETEAAIAGCSKIWLITDRDSEFFEQMGYAICDRGAVPEAIRATGEFASLSETDAIAMVKRFA